MEINRGDWDCNNGNRDFNNGNWDCNNGSRDFNNGNWDCNNGSRDCNKLYIEFLCHKESMTFCLWQSSFAVAMLAVLTKPFVFYLSKQVGIVEIVLLYCLAVVHRLFIFQNTENNCLFGNISK
uniref:C-type lectin domain-containing protein n=1 Tax=Macrostomum lignano TaxID=282301 RepID=A0A1I8IUA4_9PLAT